MTTSDSENREANTYPAWAPRIWLGFRPSAYYRLLAENRFQVDLSRWPMLLVNSSFSGVNSFLTLIQKTLKDQAILQTEIRKPPVFIIGHWRSGTTLTHELMSLDDNFSFLDNYDAFVPEHFLVSGMFRPLMRLLMPKQRPMDDMTVEIDFPQEDDFAIMAMGAPTHYRRIAFPRNQDHYCRQLDCENLDKQERADLQQAMQYFMKALTFRDQKQLVLKSPPHTGRIKLLRQWFPHAKFVHISRHPHRIVPSTLRLWRLLDDVQAFQKPDYTDDELLTHIERCQSNLYRAYRRDRQLLADDQLVEISFEQLIANPESTMGRIYDQLQLSDGDAAIAATKEYFEQRKGHRKNVYQIAPMVERINSQWADYMEMFGYQPQVNAKHQSSVA